MPELRKNFIRKLPKIQPRIAKTDQNLKLPQNHWYPRILSSDILQTFTTSPNLRDRAPKYVLLSAFEKPTICTGSDALPKICSRAPFRKYQKAYAIVENPKPDRAWSKYLGTFLTLQHRTTATAWKYANNPRKHNRHFTVVLFEAASVRRASPICLKCNRTCFNTS